MRAVSCSLLFTNYYHHNFQSTISDSPTLASLVAEEGRSTVLPKGAEV